MKTYLKDLTPDEVIRRLKAGEVVKNERTTTILKIIDGMVCRIWADGDIDYNMSISINKTADDYFEYPYNIKLEVGGRYKNKGGDQVCIFCCVNNIYKGVIMGTFDIFEWNEYGSYYKDGTESQLDIISEWSDDDVAED